MSQPLAGGVFGFAGVAFVDGRYRTIPDRDHRGIQGKSSGGYGSMVQAMRHPEVFGAFALVPLLVVFAGLAALAVRVWGWAPASTTTASRPAPAPLAWNLAIIAGLASCFLVSIVFAAWALDAAGLETAAEDGWGTDV